ncbi:alcohol dehydrogenase catalytic domain-containing protein [Mesomycoplasma hyopneumoniae]|uniref:alcohol dehydrogenase catalytic domain-containing protein n=1 Tax=Mesomycoplasma hyopneumoniae TaxID=2099 RepID=UPI003DA3AE0D
MKALVYRADHSIALENVVKPVIQKPTDAIVRVTKTTICGIDLGIFKGKNPEVASGRILGHEGIAGSVYNFVF